MNEKEEMEKSYIATCKICLLAQAMKDCPGCRFNIGLVEKAEPVVLIPVPNHKRIVLFAMAD